MHTAEAYIFYDVVANAEPCLHVQLLLTAPSGLTERGRERQLVFLRFCLFCFLLAVLFFSLFETGMIVLYKRGGILLAPPISRRRGPRVLPTARLRPTDLREVSSHAHVFSGRRLPSPDLSSAGQEVPSDTHVVSLRKVPLPGTCLRFQMCLMTHNCLRRLSLQNASSVCGRYMHPRRPGIRISCTPMVSRVRKGVKTYPISRPQLQLRGLLSPASV